MADAFVARRYEVTGRVQGVGFRDFTQRTASSLGITGTVRNTSSGSVEIAARGTPDILDQFEQTLRKGPPSAKVLGVDRTDLPNATPSDEFRIVR